MSDCRVFTSAGIEGVAGVVTTLQTKEGNSQYREGRQLMTDEVNAAIAGAFERGATTAVACDSHAGMQNLIPARLDEPAVLIRGAMRDSLQMEGLDALFLALFVVGTHARAGPADAVRRQHEIRPMLGPHLLITEIDYIRTDMAQTTALVPDVVGIDPRTVLVEADSDAILRPQELLIHRLRYEA